MTHTPNAALTAKAVLALRQQHAELVAAGLPAAGMIRAAADSFKVSVETIRRAVRGETFRHVAGLPAATLAGAGDAGEAVVAAESLARLQQGLAGVSRGDVGLPPVDAFAEPTKGELG